jgi:hypothetical protein
MSDLCCNFVFMNKNYIEIAFILDPSGSMGQCRDAAIEGFNRFLGEQQQTEGLAKLTLILFDDEYLAPVRSLPVQEVTALNTETYVPRNCTALLDAIGTTINDLGKRLSEMPEQDRPGQVIVTILTDGLENASQKFTWRDVSALIKQQTEIYKWAFLFLGANQDAIATAARISIAGQNAATYAANAAGTRSSHKSLSRKVSAMRKMSAGTALAAEVADAEAPISQILKEEEQKDGEK